MNIMGTIEDLEKRRKMIQLLNIVTLILFFALFFFYFAYATSTSAPVLFLLIILIIVIFRLCADAETREFKKIYKETFVVGAIKEVLGNVTYEPLGGFTEHETASTGLIQMGNRFSSEDYIAGSYEGVHFKQSDVVVKRVVRSGKSTHTYIHFSGRLFEFDCPYEGNVSTLLFSKNYQYPGRGTGARYQKVQMENDDFNKRFKIKAVQEIDAFYILTPHMMECVDNILVKAKSVGLHFTNNKLYVGINYGGKGAFDANMNKRLVYADQVAKVKADTQVIMDIIKTLKLDQNARQEQIRKNATIENSMENLTFDQPEEENFFFSQPPVESKFGFKLKQ